MMRIVRGTIGTWLAAALLTLSIGVQVLEATGHWDRTFKDAADEAVIVTVALCIGAALVGAAARRPHFYLSAINVAVVIRLAMAFESIAPSCARSLGSTSPPLSLRI